MSLSVFDLFKIGVGPSSSHTVGPMRAARSFAVDLQRVGLLERCTRIDVELFGSLGATGVGHGSPRAIMLGLMGEKPETVPVEKIEEWVEAIQRQNALQVMGEQSIAFDPEQQIVLKGEESLPAHPNGMRFTARDEAGTVLRQKCYYSVGGGFVVADGADADDPVVTDEATLSLPFSTGRELLQLCARERLQISDIMLINEQAWRSVEQINTGLDQIWATMHACIEQGCREVGFLPGSLKVKRRAASLYQTLKSQSETGGADTLSQLDWVSLYAIAVNEVNAMGGRMVTAPTNGAAGIIPAVLRYYMDFHPSASPEQMRRFLLTAGAIGILYKINASISGAEVGCQGEVGSACSMAAGALAEVMGATPPQVENAAEIAMEHNLGLTCDPINGLVQVPCIERNAMAAIKAISAARMALKGDGTHYVSLDQVIATMRETGRDMQAKYKETSTGGLAVNVTEVPVSIIEC